MVHVVERDFKTLCTIVLALAISSFSLTGILCAHEYCSFCHPSTSLSLNDSLVQPISPIIVRRCNIHVLMGYSQLYDLGSGYPQFTVGLCAPLVQDVSI